MARRSRRPFARGTLGLGLLVGLGVAAPPQRVPAQVVAGVNLVRLEGVLGETNVPGNMLQSTLIVGMKHLPFSVLAAQRLSGDPMNGPGILLATGTDQPVIRLVGRTELLRTVLDAPAGTRAVLVGNFSPGQSYLTLMTVELPESTGAKENG